MWLSRSEMRRLLKQVADAESRAERAEDALATERQSKDWLITQLTSRVITKHGGYGLSHEPQLKPDPTPNPRQFVREVTPFDEDRLEYYKKCFRDAGREDWEEAGLAFWEAEMRGETPQYPYEEQEQTM